jgi:putative ABC transport system permease protein
MSLAHDIRYAARSLRARPGFTAAVVATLALGIGASTAMYSLLDAAVLRSLPFEQPDRLVVLWGTFGKDKVIRGASFPEAQDWRTMTRALSDVSVYDQMSVNLRTIGGTETAERIGAELVSASYFPLLGARAARGRTFLAEEDQVPDARPVVVISHDLWQQRFAGDPAVVGRAISLNDRPFTVVGVMPAGFKGLSFGTDVWVPGMSLSLYVGAGSYTNRANRWLMAFGRLHPGQTTETAQRDLDAVAAQLERTYPATNQERGVTVVSLRDNYLGSTRRLLVTLFASVLLFLLIACANVAGLQLVRATARRREVALRLALGASRAHLARQLLAEGALVGAVGAAVGLAIAFWSLDLAAPALPAGLLPGYARVALNGPALAFSLVTALFCGMACAVVPAFRHSRENLASFLKEGGRSASAGLGKIRRPGAQQLLVVGEVALALVLLVGAGLMLRSLRAQLAVTPGFRAEGVLAGRLSLPRNRYNTPELRYQFAERALVRLRAIPGVAAATVATDLPFTGNISASALAIPGANEQENRRYYRHQVTPGYFEALGIPLRAGRDFTADDRFGGPRVAIVSEAMARRFWPNENAVGRMFKTGDAAGPSVEVVGVVASARFRDLTTNLAAAGSEPDVYYPLAQFPDVDLEIAVRSRGSALVSATLVRDAIAGIDAGVPLYAIQPLSDAMRGQSATGRFASFVLGAFSTLALVLAAIGIYGVIAFVVGLSRREIAIRMALGARAESVLGLVVRNGMMLVGVGVVLGVVVSLALAGVMRSQLYGVSPTDPLTIMGVAGAVLVVALFATWIPGRRAARVDPGSALRAD